MFIAKAVALLAFVSASLAAVSSPPVEGCVNAGVSGDYVIHFGSKLTSLSCPQGSVCRPNPQRADRILCTPYYGVGAPSKSTKVAHSTKTKAPKPTKSKVPKTKSRKSAKN